MGYEVYHLSTRTLLNAITMTSTQTSLGTPVENTNRICFQAVWTGTSPVGTFDILASNDNITYTVISSQNVSGNSGSLMSNSSDFGYLYVQARYTYTSGTGTMTVTLAGSRK